MVECKASVKQPGQATEVLFDNAVPEVSGGKQTFITDFFRPRPTTSSADVPRSSDTTRTFIKASEPFQLSMRDEEEEEEEGVTPKESGRLNLIHLGRTVLLMPTTRLLDICGAAFMFIFTISMVIYGIFHLAL